jgi:hypothetical protein
VRLPEIFWRNPQGKKARPLLAVNVVDKVQVQLMPSIT